jgi:seryl-tRNA(Sec) selenium transferase
MSANRHDLRLEMGLRPVINASGTMTFLGASIVVPQAVDAMARTISDWVPFGMTRSSASTVSRDQDVPSGRRAASYRTRLITMLRAEFGASLNWRSAVRPGITVPIPCTLPSAVPARPQ